MGFASLAFVLDACACGIGGWRTSLTVNSGFVLDMPQQAR